MQVSLPLFMLAICPSAAAFHVTRPSSASAHTVLYGTQGLDMSGNTWKPASEKMGSTDTGDYFPEGYDPNEIAFTEGWKGSQQLISGGDKGLPTLPGLENLGKDAVVMEGIKMADGIPEGMKFVPSSVPDGEFVLNVQAASGGSLEIPVKPVAMTFEDYYAAFAPASSHPSFSVTPATGRMDRRGGEPTILNIRCDPNGATGTFEGDLVINLPEDNSKICFKIKAQSF